MKKPLTELVSGDVIVALTHPDGRTFTVRGGPMEVASIEWDGREWDGAPQVKIVPTRRSRSARFANGATHAVLADTAPTPGAGGTDHDS